MKGVVFKKNLSNTKKSLLLGIISILLLFLVFTLLVYLGRGNETNFLNLITFLLILFTLLLNTMGFLYAIKGLNNKKDFISILAFLVNCMFPLLIITLLLINVSDLAKWIFL